MVMIESKSNFPPCNSEEQGADKKKYLVLILGLALLTYSWTANHFDASTQTLDQHPCILRWMDDNLVCTDSLPLDSTMVMPAQIKPMFFMKIPINEADEALLQLVPGIGAHLADAIVTYRNEIGSFYNEYQLLEVPGIGPKRKELLTRWLTFDE